MQELPRLISLEAAAEQVSVSPRTLRRAIADGRLTGYRLGKRILRIDAAELANAFGVVPTAGNAA